MQCEFPGNSLRVFGKAVHCLSKFGQDLFFECLPDRLTLRTVNSSRSAFAYVVFLPRFFSKYHVEPGLEQSTGDPDDQLLRFKALNKSCQAAFKSLATLEKTVERCTIAIDLSEARLIIRMHCKEDIVKTHRLYFEECEMLQAVYDKQSMPNVIVGPARLLSDTMANFQQGQEEVSLQVTNDMFVVSNATELDAKTPQLKTVTSLEPQEFNCYQIHREYRNVNLTLCMKEFKSVLGFCEYLAQPLSMYFSVGGQPIIFSVRSDELEADFVLATMMDPNAPIAPATSSSASSQRAPTASAAAPSTQHSQPQRPSQWSQTTAVSSTTASAARGAIGGTGGGGGGGGIAPRTAFHPSQSQSQASQPQTQHRAPPPPPRTVATANRSHVDPSKVSSPDSRRVAPGSAIARQVRPPPPPTDEGGADMDTSSDTLAAEHRQPLVRSVDGSRDLFMSASDQVRVAAAAAATTPRYSSHVVTDNDGDENGGAPQDEGEEEAGHGHEFETDFVDSTPPRKKFRSMFDSQDESEDQDAEDHDGAAALQPLVHEYEQPTRAPPLQMVPKRLPNYASGYPTDYRVDADGDETLQS